MQPAPNDNRAFIAHDKLARGKCANDSCMQVVTENTLAQFHCDHLNVLTKKHAVGEMLNAVRAELEAELHKCQLLCYDCHAERTAAQVAAGEFTFTRKAKRV